MKNREKIEVEIDGEWVEFDPAVHSILNFKRFRTSELMTRAEAEAHFGGEFIRKHLKKTL